eukprot:3406307-Alexandrium_andersonii.AAC.1
MSASLVGSEMCIRDRDLLFARTSREDLRRQEAGCVDGVARCATVASFSVLYVSAEREWYIRAERAESSTSSGAQEGPLVQHVMPCASPACAPQLFP